MIAWTLWALWHALAAAEYATRLAACVWALRRLRRERE